MRMAQRPFFTLSNVRQGFRKQFDMPASPRSFTGSLAKRAAKRARIALAMSIKRMDNVKTVVACFRKVVAIHPRQAVSVLCPLSGLRSQLHNSEDAFTSADMFASWVRVRSKRNGPLSWMRVPGVGGGNGIGKVGSRRSLRETPFCQLIMNSGHRATRLVN